MSNYIISCGGTGGHLSPGIALAEGLAERGHSATLLISQKRVDARLIEKYPHLRFVPIPGTPFTCSPTGLVRFLVSQTKGFL
jgi:UDP-N-acetylglucosamine--N-acetylmuramyl-(pentapeptide) pyrophosphoryl-undecaprenol N-acetylglucosamine transferase